LASGKYSACQQIVDSRIQALLGRIPWLGKIVVEVRFVDRPDCSIDIGVSGQQNSAREGVNGARLGKQLAAHHARHALIADDNRQSVAAALEFAHGAERFIS
jgi:hypothetical protein